MAKQDDNIDEVREALNVMSVKYQEEKRIFEIFY